MRLRVHETVQKTHEKRDVEIEKRNKWLKQSANSESVAKQLNMLAKSYWLDRLNGVKS